MGTPFNFTVNAVDAYWNFIATAPADIIAITSTDGTATLPMRPSIGHDELQYHLQSSRQFHHHRLEHDDALIANGVSASIISGSALVWQGDGSDNLWNTV